MIQLANTYKGGYSQNMTLLHRENNYAIYKDENDEYYEVFKVKERKAKEVTWPDGRVTQTEHREVSPTNEDFGVSAYACNNVTRAFEMLEVLKNKKPAVCLSS